MLRQLIRRIRRWGMRTIKPFGRSLPRDTLRISLCDRNPDVARALAAFLDVGDIEVLECDLLGLSCDAVVSPANSFGSMDGGSDHHIDRHYDGDAQRRYRPSSPSGFTANCPSAGRP